MKIRHFCALPALAAAFLPLLSAQQYSISTVVGNGSSGYSGDSGPAPASQLNQPDSVAVDSKGNLYIADSANQVIRMVAGGTITTVAGSGTAGYTGDGSSATKAQLNNPAGVAVDSSGNLYIADTGNNVIRKVSGGNISTFAGNVGNSGNGPGYGGDGGPATSIGVLFAAPTAVALDSAGNVYIVDSGNGLIREVSGGNINTVVGSGATATRLNRPTGIALDKAGNIYIADAGNRRVAKFSADGTLTTLAGNGLAGYSGDNGPAVAASLNNPTAVALDAVGNVYIADRFNSRIRKVNPAGTIISIAGNSRINYTGDGGLATAASLNFPYGVAADSTGNIYVADTTNNVIRLLQPVTPVISGGVVNSAGGAPVLSAGALGTITGANFAPSTVRATPPWQTTLGGVTVTVNGQAAPIMFVNGTQVNFQVPWATTGDTASITVSVNGLSSAAVSVPLTPAAPGLFVDSTGAANVSNADSSQNSPSNPAQVGSTIQAYFTGTGPLSASVADGALPPADGDPIVLTLPAGATIGDEPAVVLGSGLSPSLVGVAQLTIVVPPDLATGSYPLVLAIGNEASNAGTISVTQ